jgi:hypothetical protein
MDVRTLTTLVGFGMAMHHWLKYRKWYDKGEKVCHGRIGLIAGSVGSLLLLLS